MAELPIPVQHAPHPLIRLSASLLVLMLGGCGFVRPFINAEEQLRDSTKISAAEENDPQPELTVETANWSEHVFRIRPMKSEGVLPHRRVEKLSVTEAGLYDVIQLLFEGTDLAVTFEGGTDNIRRYGPVTAYNLNGTLSEVMANLGQAVGFFWSLNNKTVTIEAEQQFVVDLPPVLNDDNLAGITNTLQYLGVRDSYLDRNERRLVFRCNRKVLSSVEGYMARLRESRSMIIYDVQILQVDLRDAQKMGIQWGRYVKNASEAAGAAGSSGTGAGTTSSTGSGTGSSVIPTTGNAGFDITLVGNSFRGNVLIEFLRTQGTVKNLSKPRIGIMSGTRGSLRVGNNTTIVSKVGRDLTNAVSQTTVETKDVKTGLELNLFGEEHDRTVYTRISLSITELLELTTFEALGTKLSLPKIADREMRTQIRTRPGDTIILGGITINRAANESAVGVAINSRNNENNVSELVVVLKPRLVLFRPASLMAKTPVSTGKEPEADTASPTLSSPILLAPPAVQLPTDATQGITDAAASAYPVSMPMPQSMPMPLPTSTAVSMPAAVPMPMPLPTPTAVSMPTAVPVPLPETTTDPTPTRLPAALPDTLWIKPAAVRFPNMSFTTPASVRISKERP